MGQNKALAHELAVKWWKNHPKEHTLTCDLCCMTDIHRGEGYICDPSSASANKIADMLKSLGQGDVDLEALGISNNNPDLLCESCFDRTDAVPYKGKI